MLVSLINFTKLLNVIKRFFSLSGADLHAVALCCLLQVVCVAPEKLADMFHDQLDWIKVCYSFLLYRY